MADSRAKRLPFKTKTEVLEKLKPIYEDYLKNHREEEELIKMDPKSRERER